MLEKTVKALLDTGSETSIVPLKILHDCLKEGVNLDKFVERIPNVTAVVRNASGDPMNLLGAIRLPLTLNNRTELVSCFIGKGMDDLVILGTNALELFGMKLGPLKSAEVLCATKPVEVVMKDRVFIPPHSAKVVTVASAVQPGEYVMLSKDPGIAPGVCTVTAEGTANVNMVNSSNEARVVRKGDVIGHWASGEWLPSNVWEVGADMLEHGPKDVQIDDTARATELIDVLRTNTSMTPELEETI
ncbi:unnamed protein product, partial [Heligmosomoides polygyrus]|uniref:Peptidase A2 domain-containing protein n=1 Tax=Heligmosomoides polygyrus TaxID=6339 RepID=A0A183FCI5_HELPZ